MTSDRDKQYFVTKILHNASSKTKPCFPSGSQSVCGAGPISVITNIILLCSPLLSSNYLICKTRLVINVTVRHSTPGFSGTANVKQGFT